VNHEAPLMTAFASPEPSSPPSAADRVCQAARFDSSPDALRQFAQDPDVIVRAALAINGACSPDIDAILASDADDRVRALLGSRIARLLPHIGSEAQGFAAEHVYRTLSTLAKDQATRVRAAIADEIKSMDVVPRELVMLLAQDEAVEVSAPILRLSPLLTDGDLLMLMATPPFRSTVETIANRPRLNAAVADAIVARADAPTIRTLLANRSACIQEATLDALVGRAPNHIDWHAPLVCRPNLSAKSIRALSEFITVDLLRILASRVDLDPAKIDIVRRRLTAGIAEANDATMLAEALRLKADQRLTELAMLQAIDAGDLRRLGIFLAAASGVTICAVDRVIELRSAKGLVSLVWSGGFSMRVGAAVQASLAQFAPDHALLPTASGGFPLTTEEMEWQIELMQEPLQPPAALGPTLSGRTA